MDEGYKSKKIRELAADARGQLIGKYGVAILATLIVSSIEILLTLFSQGNSITISTTCYLMSLVITVIIDLLLGILVFGQANFYLKIARGDESLALMDLFRGIRGLTDKAILVQSIFTGFSVISLIPSVLIHFGVVYIPNEYYYYSFIGVTVLEFIIMFISRLYFGASFYILADHPEWSVPEIFRESIYLMKKKKGRLALTYLSCIPLFIVSLLACGIGVLWFAPFFQTLLANFYLDLIKEEPWTPNKFNKPTNSPGNDSPTLDIRL
jgi:uncharacterized membrane protein